ncbi:hypothetical protein AALP_AA6G123800 [Arabis alpina]|uniref:Beta-1,3-N-Acetylglucosaminyltransferase family protein n=1 Tax=Arabis alpina TaxID=50452 RepID=A0A087GNS2_ARAAL|nr:hypothetical protein AALP_AA6G123800 [Arabis alpina]
MASHKLICLVIFFAFITQGYGCEELTLTQSKTGKMVQNKPEWEVKVTNSCPCQFLNTRLSCTGFKSVTPVEISVLAKPTSGDDACLLNNGLIISKNENLSFKYVWDTSYDFKIIYTDINCS